MNAPVAVPVMPPRTTRRRRSIAGLCDDAVQAWGEIKRITDATPDSSLEAERVYLDQTAAEHKAWYASLSRAVDRLARRPIRTEAEVRCVARAALALTALDYVDRWGISDCTLANDDVGRLYLQVVQFTVLSSQTDAPSVGA
ncbi:MAG: hypothetical protein ABSC06_32005 [Rhodopila sp.]|jgi:hypothetical protein